MKNDCIDKVVTDFCEAWHATKDDVMYATTHYTNGIIENESTIKKKSDYPGYVKATQNVIPKFTYYKRMIEELKVILDREIKPLLTH